MNQDQANAVLSNRGHHPDLACGDPELQTALRWLWHHVEAPTTPPPRPRRRRAAKPEVTGG